MKIKRNLRARAPWAFFLALAPLLLPAQTQETILDVRIYLDGRSMQNLEKAGLEIDHGQYDPGQSFRSEFSASEIAAVKAAGFRMDTLDADVVATYLRENAKRKPQRTALSDRDAGPCDYYSTPTATPTNYIYGSMGGYYKYEEYLAILDDMHAKFPQLISARKAVSDSLLTHEGRPLWYVKISDHPDSDEAEPQVLYTALHHAREPNSLTHLIYFMWHLLENYDRNPELRYLLDHTELYFVPCLNPDGYIYNQTTNPEGGGYWRKNRRVNGNGSFGVDLNRNYGYNWGPAFNGSSSDPYSDVYHGPSAFSEPETRMAKAFIEAHDFEIVLNCHTSGNKLVHPWGYENSVPTPDYPILASWLTRESQYLAGSCWQTLGYLANGTSDDWMYAEKDRFAFTPETGSGFWPTIDQIDGNNKKMFLTNLSAAWYALGGAVIHHQPGADIAGNTLNVPYKIKQYELGNAPIQVSFEALTNNIAAFAPVAPISINDFETASFSVAVTLQAAIQMGETIRFVARSERDGQVHTDTFETVFQPTPFQTLLEVNQESSFGQWVSENEWGATSSRSYSPTKSMTDSPFGPYSAEENTLTSAAPLMIPANATEARLRFFAYWDIEPDLDWVQVMVSKENLLEFLPLAGSLTHQSTSIYEPVYDGNHSYWEEECMDMAPYIGEEFFLRFSMIALSGNPNGHEGFYFDNLILEYRTPNGVYTMDIPDAWNIQSNPNPANTHALLVWDTQANTAQSTLLEICTADGQLFKQVSVPAGSANTLQLDTKSWPSGLYFYRLAKGDSHSNWKKLVVGR